MTGFGELPFSARNTFVGVPMRTLDTIGDAGVVILGAPFDWGTSNRPGARFAPAAVRNADYLEPDGRRPHLDTGIDALEVLRVVDIGDVSLVPGYIEDGIDRIRRVVAAVAAAGAVPLVIGGDHTITFPNAGGVADVHGHGAIALIHFDAHADTGASHYGMLHGHGTPMRRLIESGAVPGHRFAQIGLRGYWPDPETVAWMRAQGMRSYFMGEVVERGLAAVLEDALDHAATGARGVFVSVDIDVVDPAAAPGTGTPEPGGLTARQLLDTVRRIGRDLEVVGADVVEVAPVYDPANITALLANRVILELLNGMAQRKLRGA
jgi:agmatinase